MKKIFILLSFYLFSTLCIAQQHYGIEFSCLNKQEKTTLMENLLLKIKKYTINDIVKIESDTQHVYLFVPDENLKNNNSLKISTYLNISDDKQYQPIIGKKINVTSKKEIFVDLLLSGRLTSIPDCQPSSLDEHIGVRQNITMWASNLNWIWPDGKKAFWNKQFWHYGTPNNLNETYWALRDAFKHQQKYSIGCYTATKMVYTFAILDYYKRVNKNSNKYNKILTALNRDNDPLLETEPGIMWKFEKDFNLADNSNDGKLLEIKNSIAYNSIVPGDWIYILNTDDTTYQKTGYEGSNAIYLGNNMFDDYYNDNHHHYTFEEKINEVYQWRHHVFSRLRDKDKIEQLSLEKLMKLSLTPENGGLLLNTRTVPKLF